VILDIYSGAYNAVKGGVGAVASPGGLYLAGVGVQEPEVESYDSASEAGLKLPYWPYASPA
jgi:hypothetical protein